MSSEHPSNALIDGLVDNAAAILVRAGALPTPEAIARLAMQGWTEIILGHMRLNQTPPAPDGMNIGGINVVWPK